MGNEMNMITIHISMCEIVEEEIIVLNNNNNFLKSLNQNSSPDIGESWGEGAEGNGVAGGYI